MLTDLYSRLSQPIAIDGQEIDRGVVFGVGGALLLVTIGVAMGGHLGAFLDPMGILIVLGGTFGATCANFSMYDLNHAYRAFRSVMFTKVYHPVERINYMVTLSQQVKRNGLLTLEEEANRTDDPFLRFALELTVDGQPEAEVKRILEMETRLARERGLKAVQVFETLANFAPAMGLIGTLIGLVHMLGALSDPANVGPSMALALVATFYGAILSNLVFLPIAGRLRNRGGEEILVKSITIEGILSMGRQENPIVLEQKLQGFLPIAANG